jgi:outer membrane protein assembly factor BamB
MMTANTRRVCPVLLVPVVALGFAVALAPTAACGQGCLAGTAADEFTAASIGLTREWILQLPGVAPGWHLEEVVVGDGLVVAQVNDGTTHAIASAPFQDGTTAVGSPRPGSWLWSRRTSDVGGPVTPAGIGSEIVAVPATDGVTALERPTGRFRWHETFGQPPSAGVATVGDWVYVPTSGGTVNRFAVNPVRQNDQPTPTPADAKSGGGQSGDAGQPQRKPGDKKADKKGKKKQPQNLSPVAINDGGRGHVELTPLPLADGVLWCTTDGLLVTLQSSAPDWRRLDYSLVNPPAGAPVVRGSSVFAATTAGDLARIDLPRSLRRLELAWHATLPGPARTGPFVAGDTVVVSLGELGIIAYSAETGERLWQTCLTGTILAAGGNRIWVIDPVGRLSALDLATGEPRESVCLGPFTLPVVNTVSDRLLLATRGGTLVCLAPRGAEGTPTPAAPTGATAPAAPARGPSDPGATPRP